MGWKKTKTGKAGKWSDYMNDVLQGGKQKKKRNSRKTEDYCRSIVENIFQKPFPSKRPDFLRNPETGKNLECDMMNEDLKICIERQGEQHYKEVSHFHSRDAFVKQQQRDRLKKELLAKNGYLLVEIPYTVHYDVLNQYIPKKLEQYSQCKSFVQAYNQRNK
jgi:hypothetical protein